MTGVSECWGDPPDTGNEDMAPAQPPEEHDASNKDSSTTSMKAVEVNLDVQSGKSATENTELTRVKSRGKKWPPKVPIGALTVKLVDELYKSMEVVGSRGLFDSKIDEFISTLKQDSPTGQIKRGHSNLFFAARDFTKRHGAVFWGFETDSEVDNDDLHLKIAKYMGDRNQLYQNRVSLSKSKGKRRQEANANERPAKAPKLAREAPKQMKKKDVTKKPPIRPRNEDVDTEDSEDEDAVKDETGTLAKMAAQNERDVELQGEEVAPEPEAPRNQERIDENSAPQATPSQEDIQKPSSRPALPSIKIPETVTTAQTPARPLSASVIAATSLRIKYKPITSYARTNAPFSDFSAYDSFFSNAVQLLSKRHPEASNATSGELLYAWDEKNGLEMRKGEVEDWNEFVADMEERWWEMKKGDERRLKIYFDLLGN